MEENNTEEKSLVAYYAKSAGYHTAKAITSEIGGYALIIASAFILPSMAINNQTFESDMDKTGTYEHDQVLEQLVTKKDNLLSGVQNYIEIRDKMSEYQETGALRESFILEPDLQLQKQASEEDVREFLAHAYMNGSSEEGLAISEVEFQSLLREVSNADVVWDEDVSNLLSGYKHAEHIDECRVQSYISADADVKAVFANTAKEMRTCAQQEDDSQIAASTFAIGLGSWIPALGTLLLLCSIEGATKGASKPIKPKVKKF